MLIVGEFSENHISISAKNQCWSKEDLMQLRNSYGIIYDRNIWGIWIEKRKDGYPLLHLMHEDDGHLFWDKERDVRFSSFWTSNCIELLKSVQKYIKEHPKKYKVK